jgi:tetratricopeptide (TPR) repeat protein
MRAPLGCVIPVLLLSLTGCAAAPRVVPVEPPSPPGTLPAPAREAFAEGLAAMAQHDRARDWSEPSCRSVAALFGEAKRGRSAAAAYNAGLSFQRCGMDGEARTAFQGALDADPHFARARAALAVYLARSSGEGLERAIQETRRAVIDARFSDVEALVTLAMLQSKRGSAAPDEEGANDFERARKSLQRALAIDDGYLPALNQLAILHLHEAKRGARGPGRAGKKVDTQALELASLICTQAMRKNPSYAPIYNTAGLVEVELGNFSKASSAFDKARSLDPRLFDAHLNFASLILSFRGFAEAEQAYRAALRLSPDDYDAHLGLSLALRGQIDVGGDAERLAAAERELEIAKKIAPDRPEAYFNQALLAEDFGARSERPEVTKRELARAKELLTTFLAKAGSGPELEGARKKAKERLEDIRLMTELGAKAAPPDPSASPEAEPDP